MARLVRPCRKPCRPDSSGCGLRPTRSRQPEELGVERLPHRHCMDQLDPMIVVVAECSNADLRPIERRLRSCFGPRQQPMAPTTTSPARSAAECGALRSTMLVYSDKVAPRLGLSVRQPLMFAQAIGNGNGRFAPTC